MGKQQNRISLPKPCKVNEEELRIEALRSAVDFSKDRYYSEHGGLGAIIKTAEGFYKFLKEREREEVTTDTIMVSKRDLEELIIKTVCNDLYEGGKIRKMVKGIKE